MARQTEKAGQLEERKQWEEDVVDRVVETLDSCGEATLVSIWPALERRKRLVEESGRKAEREALERFNQTKPAREHRYEVKAHLGAPDRGPGSTGEPENSECLTLRRWLTNGDAMFQHALDCGIIPASAERYRKEESDGQPSMTYFRVHDVLCSAGGGYAFLQQHCVCSDEQWEALKRGEVPNVLKVKGWR